MHAGKSLTPTETQFQVMADAAPIMMWLAGTDKLCYYFNLSWLEFTGRTMEQEYGNGWTSSVHPDDLQACLEVYNTSFDAKKPFKIEYRLKNHSGEYSWVLDNGAPRYDASGNFVGYIGSCVDIDDILNSQRLKAAYISAETLKNEQDLKEELASSNEELMASNEELSATNEELLQVQDNLAVLNNQLEDIVVFRTKELSASQQRFRNMVMTAPIGMTVLSGSKMTIEVANQHILDIWNRTEEEAIGKALLDVFPELIDQPFPKMLAEVFKTGTSIALPEIKVAIVSSNGNLHYYVDFSYDPLFDRNGNVEAILATVINITEVVNSRKQLEQSEKDQQALNEELTATNEELAAANEELIQSQTQLEENINSLEESETRFRSLISQAPIGICVIRASDLMIQEVNDSYLELVGKTRTQLENLTIWEAIPEAAAGYAPLMRDVIDTGKPFIAKEHSLILIRNGNPELVYVDFVYEPVKNNEGKVIAIMVVGIEITDKVNARNSIADIEERIRLAVEAAEIGTFDHDLTTDDLVTSDRFNTIFGFENTVTRNEMLAAIHPDDRYNADILREEGYKTGRLFYETRLLHNDGSVHWVRLHGKVYYDEARIPIRVLGTILDITEFKHLQQQKDDFISIASHELKTPITSLKASLQLLDRLKGKLDTPIIPKLIEQSNRSMTKISELIEDLLNVSRMNEGQLQLNKTRFNVAKMLSECCHHVRIDGKHQLIFQGDDQLEVYADEQRIDQVIVNFVNNAVKYAPDSKEIYLIAEKQENAIKIAVKDSGAGVSAERLPHLFERYYRADDSGFQISGLGLGLYISAEIITRHGGQIGVDSEVGKGSTFWFTLPLG